MTTPPAFAANLIRASRRAMAGAATARLFDASPEMQQRYGPDAFELWKGHLVAQLEDLAAAIDEDDPRIFVRQLRWFRGAAASRDVSEHHIQLGVRTLEQSLRERMPQVSPSIWDRMFSAAEASLHESLAPEEAFVADGSDSARFLTLALEGNPRAARALATDLLASARFSAQDLIEDLLLPVQREAGRRWHTGEISVAQEHMVTSTVRAAVADVGANAPIPSAGAPGALIAAVAGDAHDIALFAIACLLEDDGWRACLAGADTPAFDLAQAAASIRADVVILSATLPTQRRALRDTISELKVAPEFDAKILVGGAAVQDSSAAMHFGADGYAPSIREAIVECDRLIDRA